MSLEQVRKAYRQRTRCYRAARTSLLVLLPTVVLSTAWGSLEQVQQQWLRMVDPTAMDTTCAACSDFYTYANGAWLKRTTLQPNQQFLVPLLLLRDRANLVVQSILELDARQLREGSLDPGTTAGQLGAFFASCVDSAAIVNAGTRPLQRALDTIAAIQTPADLARAFAIPVGAQGQRLAPFWVAPTPDPNNSSVVIISALGGPSIAPLFLDSTLRTEAADAAFVERSRQALLGIGLTPAEAELDARADFRVNEALGRASPSIVDQQDPRKNYNRHTFDQLVQLTPHFPWRDYYRAMGMPETAAINVVAPAYYTRLDSLIANIPLRDWQASLRVRLLEITAQTRTVNEAVPRARTCAGIANNRLGRATAREYAARELTPDMQRGADQLLESIIVVLRERIQQVDWMGPATRREALSKVDRLRRRVGAPAVLAAYDGLRLAQDDFYGNLERIEVYLRREGWAKVGKPVDTGEWRILPQVANAGYWPESNQIGIPASFLHPPYFDPAADDASNYGALGSVIGHELTHAFDNNGRRYDASGTLRDWWLAADDARYTAATRPLVAQFDAYTVLDSATHVRGQQVLDENIADLGGLRLAYIAFQRSMRGKPRTKIDGFTPEQRFFLAFAQASVDLRRPEALKLQIVNDWHAPAQWRVNGVLSNFPEFAKAWGCKTGDAMVRGARLRPHIW